MVSDMNIFVRKLFQIAAQTKVFFLIFFTFEVPFNRLFAPTSRSRMSNIFRDSESLGKRNEGSGLTFEHFCLKVVKNCRAKKSFFFFADFALVHPPMASVLLSASVERCFVSRMRNQNAQIDQDHEYGPRWSKLVQLGPK